jgi:hypothetical protein
VQQLHLPDLQLVRRGDIDRLPRLDPLLLARVVEHGAPAAGAGTDGDAAALGQAAADRHRAAADFHRMRDELARVVLAGLRAAAELYPGALAALVRDQAAGVGTAATEIRRRLDDLEDAVVDLEARGAGVVR